MWVLPLTAVKIMKAPSHSAHKVVHPVTRMGMLVLMVFRAGRETCHPSTQTVHHRRVDVEPHSKIHLHHAHAHVLHHVCII